MEDLILKYPHLGNNIFNKLDKKSLLNCIWVDSFHDFFESNRLIWRRIIRNYAKNHIKHKKDWKLVISKTPVEDVEQLAKAVYQFYTFRPHRHFNDREEKKNQKYPQHSPLHILAERGNLSQFIQISEKIGLGHPRRVGERNF